MTTDDQPDTGEYHVDRVQYLNNGDEPLKTVVSSIVPEKESLVLIDGEEYQVYHTTHSLEEDGHIATVFCWPVDEDREEYVERILERTLRYQREKHEEWNDEE